MNSTWPRLIRQHSQTTSASPLTSPEAATLATKAKPIVKMESTSSSAICYRLFLFLLFPTVLNPTLGVRWMGRAAAKAVFVVLLALCVLVPEFGGVGLGFFGKIGGKRKILHTQPSELHFDKLLK